MEAKVSGYERATFGTRSRATESARTTPRAGRSSLHMRRVTSPRALSGSSVGVMKKSSSDHNLRNVTSSRGLVTFGHLSAQDVMESEEYSSIPSILVSHDHPLHNYSHSSMETLESLLKQANLEMARETVPILLTPSTSQPNDATLTAADLSTTQPSPPQKEESESTAENTVASEVEEQTSSRYENLHEQLQKKKASLVTCRSGRSDGDLLDPEGW